MDMGMVTASKWVATGCGGPEVLSLIEADVPEPGPGEVTIEVRAAGVNPADYKHFAAGQDPGLLPLAVGYEVAGGGAARGPRAERAAGRRPGRGRGGGVAGQRRLCVGADGAGRRRVRQARPAQLGPGREPAAGGDHGGGDAGRDRRGLRGDDPGA